MKNSAAEKRKQVPVGYLVIGVDPHKKKHAAVVITQDFTIHSKFKFDNSREGFEMVLEKAKAKLLFDRPLEHYVGQRNAERRESPDYYKTEP